MNDVFRVVSFYERRIRRIFPALFAVAMFSYVLAFSLFMPEQFLAFGKSLVSATLFSSNIVFWLESGYFDGPAEMKPLLHTWSLAVEEQFYIVFPIFLILVKRYFHGRWIAFTLPLALISFVISVWGVNHQPSATFYLAPTRAWELLLGSLLALGLFPSIGDRIVREALSVLGLGLIA